MRVIKRIIKKIVKRIQFYIYCMECKIKKQKKYILFGTPLHGNLGDHAIVIAEKKMLSDINIKCFEVATDEESYCYKFLKRKISKDTVILITGGGNIGSEWLKEERFIRQVVEDFKENKIIIFPQTIFYKETEQRNYRKTSGYRSL